MAAGIAFFWVGYTLTWWGWRRVTACDGDLLGLIVPGRLVGRLPSRCAGADIPNASDPGGGGGGATGGGGGGGGGGGSGGW